MDVLARFLTYAADFEKTLADDDWERLTPYFAADAVYRVESNMFGCELTGPAAIFQGMKKSLDGFDRTFSSREITLNGEPHVEGGEMRIGWTLTYHKEGLPPFVLRGSSLARMNGDQIALLVDSYDDEVRGEAETWMRETGVSLDPSYV